jgi:hypothetical protein
MYNKLVFLTAESRDTTDSAEDPESTDAMVLDHLMYLELIIYILHTRLLIYKIEQLEPRAG